MTAAYMRRKRGCQLLISDCLTESEPWASEARQATHLSIYQFVDGLLIERIGPQMLRFLNRHNTISDLKSRGFRVTTRKIIPFRL
jgi:hypothetical protein